MPNVAWSSVCQTSRKPYVLNERSGIRSWSMLTGVFLPMKGYWKVTSSQRRAYTDFRPVYTALTKPLFLTPSLSCLRSSTMDIPVYSK